MFNNLREKVTLRRTDESASYSMMDVPHHVSQDWRVPIVVPTQTDLQAAADVLNAGKKVAIVVGAGAKGAWAEVEQLAETLGAPVAKAYLGKDVLTDDSPYTTGGLGVWGTPASAAALQTCDTFLMISSSFPYYAYLPRPDGARGVQIDLKPEWIGLRFPVEVGLVGDAHETISALLPLLTRNEDRIFLTQAQEGMVRWRETLRKRGGSDRVPMRGQTFAEALSRQLDDDAIICGDSGQNTFWLSRHISIRGEQKTSGSGTLATMASGLPYVIGAQVALPGQQVVAFVGDGGLTMLLGEIATCVKYKLPVKIFVAKNNVLGMIRWEQMLWPHRRNGGPIVIKNAEGGGTPPLHRRTKRASTETSRSLAPVDLCGPAGLRAARGTGRDLQRPDAHRRHRLALGPPLRQLPPLGRPGAVHRRRSQERAGRGVPERPN